MRGYVFLCVLRGGGRGGGGGEGERHDTGVS